MPASQRPHSSTVARPAAYVTRAQSAPATKPHLHAPAPAPLPKSRYTPAMVAHMREIVVKPPPKPVKLRPTQRPLSAVHVKSLASTAAAAPVDGANAPLRPASACVFGDTTTAGGSTAGASGGVRAAGLASAPLRKFGSTAPPDRSMQPKLGGWFERLNAQEAADKLDGLAGTTLPSAAELQDFRERAFVAAQVARVEREAESAQRVELQRAELAARTQMHVPQSQKRFAWGSERIASALLNKFDQFTSRHEDHTRKLLWTLGTDPGFKDGSNRSAIKVTPQNFPRVCDRFGIRCDEQQASEIFMAHGLPREGCSVHKLSSRFIDSKVDMANIVRDQARRMHGDAARPPAAVREKTPPAVHVPYKHAFLPDAAWAQHYADAHAALE